MATLPVSKAIEWEDYPVAAGECHALRTSAVAVAAEEIADQDRQDQHDADHDDRPVALDAGEGEPVLQHLHEGEPQRRAEDGPAAAEDRGAAQDHGGDDVELEPGAHVGTGGGDPRDEDDGG